jgi:GNAT superfamily N-acetyltransferase
MFMQDDIATAIAAPSYGRDNAPHATSIQGHGTPGDRVTLANGRSLHVRPVGPRDANAEQAFVAGLSPVARFRRFHFGLIELPDALLRAFVNADQQRHVALVAEATDDRRIVADARYVLEGGTRTAEFAIAVSDAWQGLGLGRHLMRRLLARARRSGLEWLCGDVLTENTPMLALMNRLGARLTPHPEDASLYRACLAL